jgi:hypothetical protein
VAQPPGNSRPGGTPSTSDHEEHDMPFAFEHIAHLTGGRSDYPLVALSAESPDALADRLEALAAEALSAANALRVPGGAA